MEKNNWVNYKIEVRERLRQFCLELLKLIEMLPDNPSMRVMSCQLSKSGTSVYANYRAAMRGRSKAEFFSKLSIAVEEADETEIWIDLIISSQTLTSEFILKMHKESLELLKILASMRKKIS